MIVSDSGTELTSHAVLAWCGEIGVEWHYITPGKPRNWGELGRAGPSRAFIRAWFSA
jgi:putative transposase